MAKPLAVSTQHTGAARRRFLAPSLSSVEKDDSRDQLDRCEKISGEFVVARRDGAKVLNFIEEALDEVALAVECEIAIALGLSIGFGGNYGRDFSLRKAIDERISVVGLVCDQGLRIGIFNQALGASQIVDLACREHQIGRIAQGVNEGVNFCCQSATRSADSLVAVFF